MTLEEEREKRLRQVAAWMRSARPGTVRVNKAWWDLDDLLTILGGSPTLSFPVIWVDHRPYTIAPAGSEVLITLEAKSDG